MATILLSGVGAAVGSGVGGTALGLSGAALGRSLGAIAGRAVDQRLLGNSPQPIESGKIDQFRLSGVGYGAPIQEVWGRSRIAGQIIWASRFMETVQRTGGGKGMPRPVTETFSYSVSLAIALCRGEVAVIGRIWADGIEITRNSLNFRFYPGSETQLPDAKIEAVEGSGLAPAYRGTSYVVIDDLQLSRFGNRVPQFSFEVVRNAQGAAAEQYYNLAQSISAVALIPGSGEYSLATTPVRFPLGPGEAATANIHTIQEMTDFELSMQQLSNEMPNVKSASLVVSWFGSDLRCGECVIQPKVEQNEQDSPDMPWMVSGVSRFEVATVPYAEGRPVYGGTPTDQAVIQAIRAIRESGKEVMFYPFILMDQLDGNLMADPWSESPTQPKLPWRGRITVSRAPNLLGTPDQTEDASLEIDRFLGSAQISDFSLGACTVYCSHSVGWGYRRFILHYAHLCLVAGGVDAFCIGSELKGLTQVRSDPLSFPMVDGLRSLAADVRSILGASVKISYAADWSEYFGYHTNDDVIFNLDPLWADENIDFIGIDNYMPISDWRDGENHADSDWGSIYSLDYLLSNISGGEGYDWFYSDINADALQVRSGISDLTYGEDWIFRFKDIYGWWSNSHHNRISGIRSDFPTEFQARSKQIRFTEYGCAALDKATNQPNKFLDLKSSESSVPRFSSGTRDDFIQMQYFHAMAKYWQNPENNPMLPNGSGHMVDFDRSHAWAWDVRPFPDFPMQTGQWADSLNYYRGHWINGRTSNQQVSAVIAELTSRNIDYRDFDVSLVLESVRGANFFSGETTRSMILSITALNSVRVSDANGVLQFQSSIARVGSVFESRDFVAGIENSSPFDLSWSDDEQAIGRVRLNFICLEDNFARSSVEVAIPNQSLNGVVEVETSLVVSAEEALALARKALNDFKSSQISVSFSVNSSFLQCQVGDSFVWESSAYVINALEISDSVVVSAGRLQFYSAISEVPDVKNQNTVAPNISSPVFATFLDLPLLFESGDFQAPFCIVAANPWPGSLAVWFSATDTNYVFNNRIEAASVFGLLESEIFSGPSGLWDRANRFRVRMSFGSLYSVSELDVLNGANLVAVGDGSPDGWELIRFSNALLVAPDVFEISMLLRGVYGSDDAVQSAWPSGSFFVLLDGNLQQIQEIAAIRGLERFYKVGRADRGYLDGSVSNTAAAFQFNCFRPYSICHLRAQRIRDASILISWIRRTRIDGDGWASIEVPLGEESELYRVYVKISSVVVREVQAFRSSWVYTVDMQMDDRISGVVEFEVAQVSTSFGCGPSSSVWVSVGLIA